MTWGFTAVAGATLVSGAMGANAAESAAGSQERAAQAGVAEQARQFDITQENFQPYLEAGTQALGQYQQQIGGQPGIPQLQQFGGQAVTAPTLQQAPQLEQFEFDPRQALQNPALQFQQEMGQQALERQIGKNRLLGSGERLLEAQRFGQGLASQSIGDEFNRQLATNQARNQIASNQYGLGTQRDIQQTALSRQQLSDEQALAQQEQNRLLTQYGLSSDAYNQRLNRLAGLVDVGRGAGGTLAQAGQAAAGNTANLLQAQGEAQAAGRLGQASAWGGALQQGLGTAAYLGAFNPSGGGYGSQNTGYVTSPNVGNNRLMMNL